MFFLSNPYINNFFKSKILNPEYICLLSVKTGLVLQIATKLLLNIFNETHLICLRIFYNLNDKYS